MLKVRSGRYTLREAIVSPEDPEDDGGFSICRALGV